MHTAVVVPCALCLAAGAVTASAVRPRIAAGTPVVVGRDEDVVVVSASRRSGKRGVKAKAIYLPYYFIAAAQQLIVGRLAGVSSSRSDGLQSGVKCISKPPE